MIHHFTRESAKDKLHEATTPTALEHSWIYGSDVEKEELDKLAEDYGLDSNITRDIYDQQELPRVEYSQGAMYLFARSPRKTRSGIVVSTPVLLVLKGSLLFTLSAKQYPTPHELLEKHPFTTKNSRHSFVLLLTYLVGQYEEYIRETETYMSNTRQRLATHEVTNKDFVQFVTVERNLNEYHTNLSAMLVILERLEENKRETFGDKDLELIGDVILYINQLTVAIDSQVKLVNSIRNAYTIISNNILNQRIKALTLLTVLITLPNLFYGMFGMNVRLPFADEVWAYPAITGFTVFIVLLVYIIVRRRRF